MLPSRHSAARHAPASTYRSTSCAIGTHPECVHSTPTTAPVGVPVIYEPCDCTCHATSGPTEPRQVNR